MNNFEGSDRRSAMFGTSRVRDEFIRRLDSLAGPTGRALARFSPAPERTKRPRPQSRGRFGVRSHGLCGCPEHHGRICQVAAQAKPARMGETRLSFICDSTVGTADHVLVAVSSTGLVHYWTRRRHKEDTGSGIVDLERRSDEPPSICSPLLIIPR